MMSAARKNIFRAEVLTGNTPGDFGEIRVVHSMSGWAITLACLGAALALVLLFAYGTVAKNVVAPGMTEALASEKNNSTVVATVFVPVVHAAALAPGQRVELRYDAYPHQKYGLQSAVVRTIDSGFLYADSLPAGIQAKLRGMPAAGNAGTITYRRLTLTLSAPDIRHDGQRRKIPAGLLLEVNLPQPATPLSRWLVGNRP